MPSQEPPIVLHGDPNDPFASPERAAPLRAAFRPAREVTLEAGVFVANENPEAFAAAILDDLR